MLHVDINKSHVNIDILHVDIIYLAHIEGRSMASLKTEHINTGTYNVMIHYTQWYHPVGTLYPTGHSTAPYEYSILPNTNKTH